MSFSSKTDMLVDFTRDYDTIRQALYDIEHYDKVCVESMLEAAGSLLQSNWGTHNYNQVIVFTRCGIGLGTTSLQTTIINMNLEKVAKSDAAQHCSETHQLLNAMANKYSPNRNISKLSFMCIGTTFEPYFQSAIEVYQQFLDVSGQHGQLFVAHDESDAHKSNHNGEQSNGANNGDIGDNGGATNTNGNGVAGVTPTSAQWKSETIPHLVGTMCEANYKPFEATLNCGDYHSLKATSILIWPSPMPYADDGNDSSKMIARTLHICGFIPVNDIGSPMSISRHVILPNENANKSNNLGDGAQDADSLENDIKAFYTKHDDDDNADQSKPNEGSTLILLHGALKLENLAAVVLLEDDWYGFLHAFSDSKRKVNMQLMILPPGSENIPWLGDFRYFGTPDEALPNENPQFPIKPEKRSYSQNCVVWIKQAGLQSDVQKLLRHAKKLPDKTQQFYKELNRIRRAALSLGFVELLDGLSTLFEREILLLPQNVSPDCGIQLKHSSMELRKHTNRDLKITIAAVPTKYNQLT